MESEVSLNQLDDAVSEFEYPLTREQAAEAGDDVTLVLADGEADFAEVVRRSNADQFDSAEELTNEVMSLLPREAVGEPYQSEGEG